MAVDGRWLLFGMVVNSDFTVCINCLKAESKYLLVDVGRDSISLATG